MIVELLVMEAGTATALRDATAEAEDRLEPREVAAGPFAGSFILGLAVLSCRHFAHLADILNEIPRHTIDTSEAWPPIEEEE